MRGARLQLCLVTLCGRLWLVIRWGGGLRDMLFCNCFADSRAHPWYWKLGSKKIEMYHKWSLLLLQLSGAMTDSSIHLGEEGTNFWADPKWQLEGFMAESWAFDSDLCFQSNLLTTAPHVLSLMSIGASHVGCWQSVWWSLWTVKRSGIEFECIMWIPNTCENPGSESSLHLQN